ncbi:MAG: hypothetical protein ABI999_06840, partial [Acidobacteriota bacterium]
WKSGLINKDFDFRRIMTDVMLDEEHNKFMSITVLLEMSMSGGISPMLGYVNTTFAELNIMAQSDSGTTNRPSTVKFIRPTLTLAKIAFEPGDMTPLQQLHFHFEKGTASWLQDE